MTGRFEVEWFGEFAPNSFSEFGRASRGKIRSCRVGCVIVMIGFLNWPIWIMFSGPYCMYISIRPSAKPRRATVELGNSPWR